MGTSFEAWIGLGSNLAGKLASPQAHILQAFEELAALPSSKLLARSSLYCSPPMGPPDQPDFINAVARLRTELLPDALLDALQGIETAHNRVRERRWGARTLDLDILLYGSGQIHSSRLSIPHPGIGERAFVLYPLREIAPGLQVPGLGSVDELAANVAADGLEILRDSGQKKSGQKKSERDPE